MERGRLFESTWPVYSKKALLLLLLALPFCASGTDLKRESAALFVDHIQSISSCFLSVHQSESASSGYKWHCGKTKTASECLKGNASLSCYVAKRFLFAFVFTKGTNFCMGGNVYVIYIFIYIYNIDM